MVFPVFENSDDTLCPLTYRLSSTDSSYTEDLTLTPSLTDNGITLNVPVDLTQPTSFTFFI